MAKVIKATELHTRTRDVIDWARIKGETVVVEYYGKPAVVILGYDSYQDYLAYQEQQQAQARPIQRLRDLAQGKAKADGLTREEAQALLDVLQQIDPTLRADSPSGLKLAKVPTTA